MGEAALKGSNIVSVETSAVFLPAESKVRRLPRAPHRKRPESFAAQFEDRALYYDCFWQGDGKVLLVGPPALNLLELHRKADYVALESGERLGAQLNISRSVMTTALSGVPKGTMSISIRFGDHRLEVPVQAQTSAPFARRNVLFTMNKDNPVEWISNWADWHVVMHGADAVVVFDNGSTRYKPHELAAQLSRIPGLARVAVISWPFRYGPVDSKVFSHPYWANFLQVASFTVMLRRLGAEARGLLNCDIDELVGPGNDGGVFETLANSGTGFVKLRGRWIEGASDSKGAGHFTYRYRHRNPLRTVCANKWAIDPQREWVSSLDIFPMMHRIYGMHKTLERRSPRLPFWHFRGVNTNWKETRRLSQDHVKHYHVADADWEAAIATYQGLSNKEPSEL